MSAVTMQEIIEALSVVGLLMCHEHTDEANRLFRLAKQIETHGIAPPDGMVLVSATAVGYAAPSSLAELARGECSGIMVGTYNSERYDRTVPLYAAPGVKP